MICAAAGTLHTVSPLMHVDRRNLGSPSAANSTTALLITDCELPLENGKVGRHGACVGGGTWGRRWGGRAGFYEGEGGRGGGVINFPSPVFLFFAFLLCMLAVSHRERGRGGGNVPTVVDILCIRYGRVVNL